MIKGQMNVDFIVSAAVFIAVLIFTLLTVYNTFPQIHKESTYHSLTSNGFMAAQLLAETPGLWNGPNISNASIMGLTDGIPLIINLSKVQAFENCTTSDYRKAKELLGLGLNENMMINISEVNFSGGPGRRLALCKAFSYSTALPKTIISRHCALAEYPGSIIRVDVTVY